MARLGDYVRIRTGKLDANASSEDGAYPFFTCSREPLKIDTYSYDCECVLVAGNGDLNVKYYSGKFDAYQRTYIIEVTDPNVLLPKYLFHFLDSYVDVLRKQSIGGVIKYIKLGNLTEAIIPLPSIEQQTHIIKILEQCNFVISITKMQLSKLDELVKSRFIELSNSKQPLVSIESFVDRKISSAKKIYAPNELIKYVDISSVDNISNEIVGYAEYAMEDAPSRAQQCIQKHDIIISTVRPNLRNVAINKSDDDNLVASSGFCVLRATKCNPMYLFAAVMSDDFTETMVHKTTGANYPAIKDTDVLEYQIPDVSIGLQNDFASFVAQTDKLKLEVKQSLEKLETLKKSLMQEYFNP